MPIIPKPPCFSMIRKSAYSHNLVFTKCVLIPTLHRKGVASSPADVTVTAGDSSLSVRTPRGELSFALPAGITLEQGSCIPTPAGDSCEDELHFRLRINIAENSKEGDFLTRTTGNSSSFLCFYWSSLYQSQNKVFEWLFIAHCLAGINWNQSCEILDVYISLLEYSSVYTLDQNQG